jgi:hypothetical protein
MTVSSLAGIFPEKMSSPRPEEEGAWALPHGEFGLDVIALIGSLRYREHRSVPEIHQQLLVRGVLLAERTVTYLLQRYEELVALRLADQTCKLRDRTPPFYGVKISIT